MRLGFQPRLPFFTGTLTFLNVPFDIPNSLFGNLPTYRVHGGFVASSPLGFLCLCDLLTPFLDSLGAKLNSSIFTLNHLQDGPVEIVEGHLAVDRRELVEQFRPVGVSAALEAQANRAGRTVRF